MDTRKLVFSVALALAYMLVWNISGFGPREIMAAPPDGPGEDPAGNNLSLPAVLTNTVTGDIPAYWNPPDAGVGMLCEHYSYGCDKPETADHFSYPNTSCVETLMVPKEEVVCLTAEVCTATGGKCDGYELSELSRIYWQKEILNDWSADQTVITEPIAAAFVDWGDALEAVSWKTTSKIRVETQPYAHVFSGFIGDDGVLGPCYAKALYAGEDPFLVCKKGFQMWHVSGQGITEHWGVRATEERVSYNYDSPYQIINSGTAKLNLAKLEGPSAVCPSPGGGEEGEASVPAENGAPSGFAWDNENFVWTQGSGEADPCTWYNGTYSVELSVGGKYVYGHNWDMNTVNLEGSCPGFLKTGWWRLTFYTTDNVILFSDANMPVSAPPAAPANIRSLERAPFVTATAPYVPSVSELYAPVVDPDNNLTYIDICIVAGGGGGGEILDTQVPGHGGGGGAGGGYGGGSGFAGGGN